MNQSGKLRIRNRPGAYTQAEFAALRNSFVPALSLGAVLGMLVVILLVFSMGMFFGGEIGSGSLILLIGIGVGALAFPFVRKSSRLAALLKCPQCRELLTAQGEHPLETGRCKKCQAVVIPELAQGDPGPGEHRNL